MMKTGKTGIVLAGIAIGVIARCWCSSATR